MRNKTHYLDQVAEQHHTSDHLLRAISTELESATKEITLVRQRITFLKTTDKLDSQKKKMNLLVYFINLSGSKES